jgi:hypothetical protein
MSAIGFAVLFNVAVVCTFAWPHWLPTWVTFVGWTGIAVAWAMSVWYEYHHLPAARGRGIAASESLFVEAQREYLNRNWFEAESLLQQVLKENVEDTDARLMLATLYRHTERIEEAEDCLCQLERMEQAGKWSLEIARERNLINELGSKSETDRDGCPVSHSEPNR